MFFDQIPVLSIWSICLSLFQSTILQFCPLGGTDHQHLRSKIALILVSWPTGYNRPSRNADISWELDNWSSTSRWSNYNCPASPASAKFDKYQIFIFPTMIRNSAGQHQRLWKSGKRFGLKLEKEEERKILKIAAIKFRLGDSEVPAENTIWWSQNVLFFGF